MTRNPRSKRWPPALLLAAATVAAGAACATGGGKYQDRNMDFGSVRTVAVLPFSNLSRDNVAGDRVRDVFANMLLATGAIYVLPHGEVIRSIAKASLQSPTAPSSEEVVKLGTMLKADAVISGVVREYGEVRSGSATGNIVSLSLQMQETATGKVVWSASTTKGGVTMADRLLGSSGAPMNQVTEAAVDDLLNKLFK